MNADLVTASILGIIGIVVLAWMLWRVLGSFIPSLVGLEHRIVLHHHEGLLPEADKLIEARCFSEAVSILRRIFYTRVVRNSSELIDRSVTLHLSILSRLISISEKTGIHLENLAVVEDLVQTRGQLLRLYRDAHISRRSISSKRRKDGKDIPEWANEELSRKVVEIYDSLLTNRRTLEGQVDKLFSAVKASAPGAAVTYH